jgi:competence protein ComEC
VNLFGAVVVVGFTILARPEPAMVRATVMALFALGAAVLGRSRPGLPLLCAATLVLMLADPWLTRQYGFMLSVAAMAGLCVLARPAAAWLTRHRIPRRAAEAIACAFAAELFCLPLIVTFSSGITLLAVPASMLAQPAVGPVTVLGALALLGDLICHPLGAAIAWVAQWPTAWIVAVARVGAAIPGAWIPWPGQWRGTVALLGCYVLAWCLIARRRHSRETTLEARP